MITFKNVCSARNAEAILNKVATLPHQAVKAPEGSNLAKQTTRVDDQYFSLQYCRHCSSPFVVEEKEEHS